MTNLMLDEDSSPSTDLPTDDSPDVAALLLTNVATIASNELNHNVLTKPMLFNPSVMALDDRCDIVPGEITCACLHYDYGIRNKRSTPTTPPLATVSSDDDENQLPIETRDDSNDRCRPIVPSSRTKCTSSPIRACRTRTNSNAPPCPLNSNKEYLVQKPRAVRQVLSKKFSWKNYPELENYLIVNREEYLMHSLGHNYSAEQKKFNNDLTEGILELATKHGYVFDNFSFVMLRDKIRCYYKSYLQTLRKKKQRGYGI